MAPTFTYSFLACPRSLTTANCRPSIPYTTTCRPSVTKKDVSDKLRHWLIFPSNIRFSPNGMVSVVLLTSCSFSGKRRKFFSLFSRQDCTIGNTHIAHRIPKRQHLLFMRTLAFLTFIRTTRCTGYFWKFQHSASDFKLYIPNRTISTGRPTRMFA